MSDLIVSEIFGPTVQGEGPSIGRRTAFLRLGICNLACTFCDTKYTWDWKNYDPKKELKRLSQEQVLDCLRNIDVGMLVVTGGEPLLQKDKLFPLLKEVQGSWSWRIEVETAGTVSPGKLGVLVHQFNVSPKLSNSGNPEGKRYKPDVLRFFAHEARAIFKFVVMDPMDLWEIDAIVQDIDIDPSKVYVMPEGRTPDRINEVSQRVGELAISRGYNLTTRLHVLLWGDKRGV